MILFFFADNSNEHCSIFRFFFSGGGREGGFRQIMAQYFDHVHFPLVKTLRIYVIPFLMEIPYFMEFPLPFVIVLNFKWQSFYDVAYFMLYLSSCLLVYNK